MKVGERPRTAALPASHTRRLRVVEPAPARSARRRMAFLLLGSLLVGVLVTGIVSLQALVSESSFRIRDLGRRVEELELRRQELLVEVEELGSLDRIEREARVIGLRPAEPDQVVFLGPGPDAEGPPPASGDGAGG